MPFSEKPILPKTRKRIFLVDDHPIVRCGLRYLIGQSADLEICGEAWDPPQALQAVCAEKPDVVVLEISIAGGSGLDLIRDIMATCPDLEIIVFSDRDERLYAERAVRAGASGYVMKRERAETLLDAIRDVLSGKIFLSSEIRDRLVARACRGQSTEPSDPVEVLSDRELEIFRMIGQGLQTRDIAAQLHLSIKTVETHRERLKRKMNMRNATELLFYAMQRVHQLHLPVLVAAVVAAID